MLIIALVKLIYFILLRYINNLRIYFPGKFLEVFSCIMWFYYSKKIHAKEIDFKGHWLDDFYIEKSNYDLYIGALKLRLKTEDFYSKKEKVRLLRVIEIDKKLNLYYVIQNASNYTGFN